MPTVAPDGRRNRQLPGRGMAVGLILSLQILAGCAPPTSMVDVADQAPAVMEAMARVPVLPPGVAAAGWLGSVGSVQGYGCGDSVQAARTGAIRQLQLKALQMHATAVENVTVENAGTTPCGAPYALTASGIAVAPRGVPHTY